MRDPNFGNKPVDPIVQITKSEDFFEAYIPPFGFHLESFCSIAETICVTVMLGFISLISLMLALYEISLLWRIISALIFLLLGVFGAYLIYCQIFILFGKTYLRIDRSEISLKKTLFDRKVSHEGLVPQQEITKIIFTCGHWKPTAQGATFKPAELKFEIGQRSIVLGGDVGFIQHQAEFEWLADEVSEWLDKPLTIIKG